MLHEINPFVLLTILAVLWCVFHSLLIALPVTSFLKLRLGSRFRFYRLGYNIFSFITLVPLLFFEQSLISEVIFGWNHPFLQIVRVLLLCVCLLLFYYGSVNYDGQEFLGFRQLKSGAHSKTLSASGELNFSGILNIIRHPWYLGSIIIIWLRTITLPVLLINCVFSLYLVVGSVLEERKLKKEFGATYSSYQKRVSMLIPWKWLWSIIKNG